MAPLPTPSMFLWASLCRNVDSINLFFWENTIFVALKFPRNNCGPRHSGLSNPSTTPLARLSLTPSFGQNHHFIRFRSSNYYLCEEKKQQFQGLLVGWRQGGKLPWFITDSQSQKLLPSYTPSAKIIVKWGCYSH